MRYPKGISRRPDGAWRISLGPGGRTFNKSFPAATAQATVEELWEWDGVTWKAVGS